MQRAWVDDENAALLTDLYQLTMLQAYWREEMTGTAVFDLFIRRRGRRNFFIACGLEDVLQYLETLRFSREALDYLRTLDQFLPGFIEYLEDFRFTGDVRAVPEGTPIFSGEPLLEVVAPIGQAQLVETFLLNQISLQTALASKAARVVSAARGCTVADFAARRTHGTDAAMKHARAAYIAGVDATSNVLAGLAYGAPVTGTMAHSYIEAHDTEADAFRAFAALYPGTTLLVDTYDTLAGIRRVIDLAKEPGAAFDVGAVRLDSGDLAALAIEARKLLDEAGLEEVRIFVSSSLDEYAITELLDRGAPIDGFGVGTRMGTSADYPAIDTAYKLSAYAGRGRMKLSSDKSNLPGRKQVFRQMEGDSATRDIIAAYEESVPGRPLLVPAMCDGRRTDAGARTLDHAREHCRRSIAELPARLMTLDLVEPPYQVDVSETLQTRSSELRASLEAEDAPSAGASSPDDA